VEGARYCLTEDEKEICVFPETFSSGFAYGEDDGDVVDASYDIKWGQGNGWP